MKKIPIITVLILLIFLISPAYSQDKDDLELIRIIEESYKTDIPVWLLMERGKQAYNIGEYGLSSRVFREVLDRDSDNPDAEVWLAYIFEKEGELMLAEKQYLKALEYSDQLYIANDEIEILYRLAEIYRKTDQYGKYETVLINIIKNDETDNIMNLQYSMIDALKSYGLNKAFELYRYKESRFNRARRDLGIFYYRTGRYDEAQINLIIPLISAATAGYDYIYRRTADYEYSDFNSHIESMSAYDELKSFLGNDGFYQTSYYLAASLYADGFSEAAGYIWSYTSEYDDEESVWKIKAERQLESPFIEPIISHRS